VSETPDHSAFQERIASSTMLADLLQTARERCHVVVVDTPPGLGSITRRVLAASQHVVVPLQCEPLALQTTPQILRAIQDIIGENPELTLEGILLTMHEAGNPATERVVHYVREHLPRHLVFDVPIPRTSATADAFAAGQPVVLRAPADAASQAYVNLATRLAERLR
jgi:chromosome partitioning protein